MAVADQLGHLFKYLFHDLKIGKHFACGKTKETCILKRANKPNLQKHLMKHIRQNCFSISTDGSNDQRLAKMNPVTAPLFNINQHKIAKQFLDMCLATASTAKGIFTSINDAFEKKNIPWEKHISLGVNSTSVNIGHNTSLERRAQERTRILS